MTTRSLSAVGVAVLGLLGLAAAGVACGGGDKPPLTPDNADGQLDVPDGSPPPAVAPAPPTR